MQEESQRRLDEIDARRHALAEEARERKAAEERAKAAAQEAEASSRKRKRSQLAVPRCRVSTERPVLSLALVQHRPRAGAAAAPQAPFKALQGESVVLCAGTADGKLEFWDLANDCAKEHVLELKADHPVQAQVVVEAPLRLPRKKKKASPAAPGARAAEPAPSSELASAAAAAAAANANANANQMMVVACCGCDLFFVSTWNWSQVHCIEDAHENQVQAIVAMQLPRIALGPGSSSGSSSGAALECSTLLLTGALDGACKGWCASTMSCLLALKGHSDAVLALELFPGDALAEQRLCSGSDDSTLCVWDVVGALCAAAQAAPPGELPVLPVTAVPQCVLKDHEDYVGALSAVRCAEHEPFLVSCSGDFSVRVWDKRWLCVRVLEADLFVTFARFVGTTLFFTVSVGEDFDEAELRSWHVADASPLKWRAGGKKVAILPAAALLATPVRVPAAEGQQAADTTTKPLVITTSADDSDLSVWACPFALAPAVSHVDAARSLGAAGAADAALGAAAGAAPAAASGALAASPGHPQHPRHPQQRSPAPAAPHIGAPAPSGPPGLPAAPADGGGLGAKYPGDALAKRIMQPLLDLPALSPDMTRVVQLALALHSECRQRD